MAEQRNYPFSFSALGALPSGDPLREKAVEMLLALSLSLFFLSLLLLLAEAIFVEWNVRNVLAYENPRSGKQHWREECPAFARAHLGQAKLIPREIGLTNPCGTCAEVERKEQAAEAQRRRRRLLAIDRPKPALDPALAPVALILDSGATEVYFVAANHEEAARIFRATHRALTRGAP